MSQHLTPYLTRDEFYTEINALKTLIGQLQKKPDRFISRQEIIEKHSRTWYENMKNSVPAIKQKGRTATVMFERRDYERYLESLKSCTTEYL